MVRKIPKWYQQILDRGVFETPRYLDPIVVIINVDLTQWHKSASDLARAFQSLGISTREATQRIDAQCKYYERAWSKS